MQNFIKKKLTTFFFIIIFFSGLLVVKNYGISYDELEYRQQGFVILNHISGKIFPEKTKKIKKERDIKYPSPEEYMGDVKNNFKIHHTIFAALEFIILKNSEKKNVFLMRHYLNFIMSMCMVFLFYKILSLNFNKSISIIGSSFFLLNPKIYPDFFYNPNDIWFTFFLLISIYFSFVFFKKKKLNYFLFLPIFVSLAVNIRIIGIYIYLIFLLFFIYRYFSKDQEIRKVLKFLWLQILIFFLSLYIMTPQIWENTIYNFFNLFLGQLTYNPIDPKILFMGNLIPASQVPWYYLPLWIIISTPLLYLILFIIGVISLIYDFIFKINKEQNFNYYFILGYFVLPVLAYFIFKPIIFNGWRHFYFLYPGLIYISTIGMYKLFYLLKFKRKNLFLFSFLIIYLSNLLYWCIKNHPHEYVFLNYPSQKYFSKFEKDYWGISNLSAIKTILAKDKRNKVSISGIGNSRIDFSLYMLSSDEKKRVNLKKIDETNINEIDYFISHFNDGADANYYKKKGFKVLNQIKTNNKNINVTFVYNK